MRCNVLILGGTTEGRRLSELLAGDDRYRVLLSYAGRTEHLQVPRVPHRVGGFGGATGLAAFLREGAFAALVDATHPFAARISANAVEAAARAQVPLLRIARPAWRERAGDRWQLVASMREAARALGSTPRRVLLTIGRLEVDAFSLAPQHDYLIRTIDPFTPALPRARVSCARGPFRLDDELALLERERIEVIVSKNAGTDATYAKIEAARALAIPVIMVERPTLPPAPETAHVDGALPWLAGIHGDVLRRRGA